MQTTFGELEEGDQFNWRTGLVWAKVSNERGSEVQGANKNVVFDPATTVDLIEKPEKPPEEVGAEVGLKPPVVHECENGHHFYTEKGRKPVCAECLQSSFNQAAERNQELNSKLGDEIQERGTLKVEVEEFGKKLDALAKEVEEAMKE